MEPEEIFRQVEAFKPEMVKALTQLIRVPAIGPENGGEGEHQKAAVLTQLLEDTGSDRIERFDADDSSVPSGKRPNIVAYLNGETDQPRLWIVTHLDVVPPGEEELWKVTKPFEPLLKDNRVFGRGSEDNGQSLVASLFAAKALKQAKVKPKHTFALAFVADEEMGSTKGILHLLSRGVFRKDDLVVVPDSGSEDGSFIEIAEKSILWLKFVTVGKQTHASLPHKGLNAHRVGMQLALALDERLHKKYSARNDYFDVPYSTFEPTKKDRNVDAVNIVPGEDVTYFDCRILPQYNVEGVLADIRGIMREFEQKTGVSVKLEILQKQSSPALENGNSETVKLLKKAIKRARGIDARVGGVGGGTCAAFFRNAGIPAVVWSTVDEVAHQQDEYSWVKNIVADAKVFALMAVL
ncbi:MAG: M20 family metallo-hydrolase [Candidatus Bathyarchaeia archaeon]